MQRTPRLQVTLVGRALVRMASVPETPVVNASAFIESLALESPAQLRLATPLPRGGAMAAKPAVAPEEAPHDLERKHGWNFVNKLGSGTYGSVWSGYFVSPTGGFASAKDAFVAKIFLPASDHESTRTEVEVLVRLTAMRKSDKASGESAPAYWRTYELLRDCVCLCEYNRRAHQYIVVERVPGGFGNLSEHCAGPKTQLPAVESARVCVQLWQAVKALWRLGVCHGDISLNNVMCAKDGPRLIDFGLSSDLNTPDGYAGSVWTRTRSFYQQTMNGPGTYKQKLEKLEFVLVGYATCYTDLESITLLMLNFCGVSVSVLDFLRTTSNPSFDEMICRAFCTIFSEEKGQKDTNTLVLIAKLLHVWFVVAERDAQRTVSLTQQEGADMLPPEGDAFIDVLCEFLLSDRTLWYGDIDWLGSHESFAAQRDLPMSPFARFSSKDKTWSLFIDEAVPKDVKDEDTRKLFGRGGTGLLRNMIAKLPLAGASGTDANHKRKRDEGTACRGCGGVSCDPMDINSPRVHVLARAVHACGGDVGLARDAEEALFASSLNPRDYAARAEEMWGPPSV